MKKNILFIFQIIIMICISIKSVYASINLNYTELNIGIDVTQELKILGDVNSDVSWSNSNNNIASLKNGYVTGLSTGTTYITVNSGTYSSTCKVNVISNYIPITDISLPSSSGELLLNDTQNINASINPSNASNKILFYSSSNPSVASVDSSGNMTGNKIGNAIITILAENKSTSYKVSVVDKINLRGISISPETMTLTEGNTGKLSISFSPENATDKSVTWKSSNTGIVTVDTSGNIKAISAGNATITVTSNDGEYTASSKITVKALDRSLKGISLNKTELTLDINETANLSVIYNPSYASNKEVTWSSSNKNIATVENGKVTAIKPGTTEIKVISNEGKYESVCKVTVLSPPIESIKFEQDEQTVYVGSITTLKTISNPQETMINNPIWTSSDETIATIENGELTALNVGKTTITISDQEGKVTASTEITVIEKPTEDLMITIVGYNLNFNPSIKNYTLKIGNKESLDIKVNRDDSKVIIGGNRDLQNGSIITITISDIEKTTYVINIRKQKSYIFFIIPIAILIIINIIRILKKNKKNK